MPTVHAHNIIAVFLNDLEDQMEYKDNEYGVNSKFMMMWVGPLWFSALHLILIIEAESKVSTRFRDLKAQGCRVLSEARALLKA